MGPRLAEEGHRLTGVGRILIQLEQKALGRGGATLRPQHSSTKCNLRSTVLLGLHRIG